MLDLEKDGIDHINVYSKGKTSLGRFLTNFSRTPFKCEDGKFVSIEGYWYWLGCKDDKLRTLSGYAAKAYGRMVGAPDWNDSEEFRRKILAAIDIKLKESPFFIKLKECKLPLVHYYVYGTKIVQPTGGEWILDHLSQYQTIEFNI